MSDWDFFQSVVAARGGGAIVSGRTRSTDGDVSDNHGSHDIWIVATDATGSLVWDANYGGTSLENA